MTNHKLFRLPTREEFDEGWRDVSKEYGFAAIAGTEGYKIFFNGSEVYDDADMPLGDSPFPTLEAAKAACYEDYCDRLTEGMVEIPEPTLIEELQETREEAEKLGNAARDAAAQRTREIEEIYGGATCPYTDGSLSDTLKFRYPEAFEQTEDE